MTTPSHLRKTAKRWLTSLREGDASAHARLRRAFPDAPSPPTLRTVQHALARERGYQSWIALMRALPVDAVDDAPLTRLLSAARSADAESVAAILDDHPHIVDERGALPGSTGARTALHFGVAHEAVVRILLGRGANPNVRDEGDNAYPLHFAAERGDLPVVRLLVEHGADPIGAGTTHGLDVLGWAVCFEAATRDDVAHYLLQHGAVHSLLTAVAMGDLEAIRTLAASGADLNQRMDRTNQRRAPLHLALVKHQVAALALLIELGADLDVADAVGLTPLDHAALAGDDASTRLLIDAGARMTLPAAILLGHDDEVERLLREDPELLSATDNRRWARVLVFASGRASGRVVATLLAALTRHRAGLSVVNMADDEETAVDGVSGYTPLHAAAFHGNEEAVDVLLRHGASARARDGQYCGTPAGWAAYAGHVATADRILEADVDIFDAVQFDRAERIVEILDADPGALERPFRAYGACAAREGQWWPVADCTPLEWAVAQKKMRAAAILRERSGGRTGESIERGARVVAFLQSACWDHQVHGKVAHRMADAAAQRLLRDDPSLADDSFYTAVVCGDRAAVARRLEADPAAARRRGGPRGWTPILYLAYTRFTYTPTIEHAVAIADLLLDAGADPTDFYMAGDARYSVLTGVAGEGEQDAPRQPYAAALFERLLARGADPFDIQVLYDTHFSGDMRWWLELVYAATIGTARGTAWHDPGWSMFDMGNYGSGARFVLETAIKTRRADLAAWALARGADPNAPPPRDQRFPQCSLHELAVAEDLREIAALLLQHGARPASRVLSGYEQFVDACVRLDRDAAGGLVAQHPEYAGRADALLTAAKRDRADVLALLVDLGIDVNLAGPHDHSALHEAAVNDATGAAAFLIQHGAEVDRRESRYGGTPLGWAVYGQRQQAMALLARHSRDVWNLTVGGFEDRLRDVLRDEPERAREAGPNGGTPLWWLPDDEPLALRMAAMLVSAGADPAAKNKQGETAADIARRRGMREVAAFLEQAASRA